MKYGNLIFFVVVGVKKMQGVEKLLKNWCLDISLNSLQALKNGRK